MRSPLKVPLWLRALHLLFLHPFLVELRRLNDNAEQVMRYHGIPLLSSPPMEEMTVAYVSEADMAIEELQEDAGGDLGEMVRRLNKER